MNVKLAETLGFCFGVRDAIAAAERAASAGELTVLGEIVHNPVVQKRLTGLGVNARSLSDVEAPTKRVLITPHGAAQQDLRRWSENGYIVLDATCPLVRRTHQQLARLVSEGVHPVIIGDRHHVEVLGLAGDCPEATIVNSEDEVELLPPAERYGIVSQTTQQIDRVRQIVEKVRSTFPNSDVHFVDTVCQPTKSRQSALTKLFQGVEAMVVIGGRNSHNTRQLVEASRKQGLPTLHVETVDDLTPDWFDDFETVGITAGASTPPDVIDAVRTRLESL
jgi:4-hydroxy-3-methylbut-2-en-1-yl diphosphate reductase